jgi:hypothetical protein
LGYSARYHAASLAAVFIALAVGILIGAGLGGNLLNDTEKNLQDSLRGDLDSARSQSDDLRAQLAREHDFEDQIYPVLAGGRLGGSKVGVIALGSLPGDLSNDIKDGLDPTGAELSQVSVVRSPPNLDDLSRQLKGTGRLPTIPRSCRLSAAGSAASSPRATAVCSRRAARFCSRARAGMGRTSTGSCWCGRFRATQPPRTAPTSTLSTPGSSRGCVQQG